MFVPVVRETGEKEWCCFCECIGTVRTIDNTMMDKCRGNFVVTSSLEFVSVLFNRLTNIFIEVLKQVRRKRIEYSLERTESMNEFFTDDEIRLISQHEIEICCRHKSKSIRLSQKKHDALGNKQTD